MKSVKQADVVYGWFLRKKKYLNHYLAIPPTHPFTLTKYKNSLFNVSIHFYFQVITFLERGNLIHRPTEVTCSGQNNTNSPKSQNFVTGSVVIPYQTCVQPILQKTQLSIPICSQTSVYCTQYTLLIMPHGMCYSHYGNGVCNGAISIAQYPKGEHVDA